MSTVKLILVLVLSCCQAARILVVFPMPSRSHGNLGDGVVRHLLKEGHEVTYISPYSYPSPSPNVRVIDVSDTTKALPEKLWTIETIMQKKIDFSDHAMLMTMLTEIMKTSAKNENVQKLLNDPNENFDVVIVEWLFSELLAGYSAVFDCPFIWVSSLNPHWAILKLIDQPASPVYTGDSVSIFTPPFTFFERVSELYTQIKVQYLEYMYIDELQGQAYDELFAPLVIKRGRKPPPFKDVQYNASLVLGNSQASMGYAIPLPQNYISVAGYHIEEEVDPLPSDLKTLMDNSPNGVIYFSMGSNLKSMELPKAIKEDLIMMFRELNQTVLWKIEEDLPNLPTNVHILRWAPQRSILSHPNTVLFIMQGGMLSTTEALHFGVPIIGIPVFGDQFVNIAKFVHNGCALKVDLSFTMVSELKLAIEEVITNPRYAEKAKKLSFIYHDRPVPPGKELAHWVNHVIKTSGAPHLRSPAINVPFYQRLYLDLLAVILVVLLLIVRILKVVLRRLFFFKKINKLD